MKTTNNERFYIKYLLQYAARYYTTVICGSKDNLFDSLFKQVMSINSPLKFSKWLFFMIADPAGDYKRLEICWQRLELAGNN